MRSIPKKFGSEPVALTSSGNADGGDRAEPRSRHRGSLNSCHQESVSFTKVSRGERTPIELFSRTVTELPANIAQVLISM